SWGLNWLEVAPGTHTGTLNHVEGKSEPHPQRVTVAGGATTNGAGIFTARGRHPEGDWGVFPDVPTGAHTVCYGQVADFDPPPCQTVTVNAGALTTTTGVFTSHLGATGQSGLGLLRVVTSPALPSQVTIQPA